jgi:hypothetical protein
MAVIPSPGLILPTSDRIDLVQGNPALSSAGIARIAMVGGVPVVSINGGAYVSFGSAGAAPAGTRQPQVRYLPTDRLDIIQGNPPVSAAGCGRLAMIAGTASVSIEGAAYASLGTSGAASAGCALSPGFLYSTDYIDIIQGNPPVSAPGTARIACAPGATSLSISIEGAAYVPFGVSVSPPATNLLVRFFAQNLDGLGNSSLIDGQGMGTVVNLGSGGATYNVVQAVGANQPLYRAVAAAGKINNKPALEGDGARGMASGAIALAQPTTMFALVKVKSSQGAAMITDGNAAQMQWGFISLQSRLFCGAAALTGQSVTIGQWQLIVAQFNGASSFARMDGAQSGAINPGGGSGDLLNFLQGQGAGFRLDAFCAEFLIYNALLTAPQIAAVETYFAAMYGVTPQ